ncbi:NAD(P)-dependent oxidoreductase [Arenicellales bacterium nBUS_48]
MIPTINTSDRVAVCSRSFSRHPLLRKTILSKFDQVRFNDNGLSLNGDSLIEFLRETDFAITALETVDDYILSNLPQLKRISKYGVGLDMIDMQAIRRYGKQLAWVGGVNRRSVAELALTMMLSILRKIPESQSQISSAVWKQTVGNTLSGKVIGIIGCGNIGQDLVALLKPFNCKILVNDIQDYQDFYRCNDLEAQTLESLLAKSDIVTLHVPLDETTKNIISKERLSLMKSNSILINTARGGLIDEKALVTALKDKNIFGAGLDVFEVEPPFENQLLSCSEVFPTAHIGGSAEEAIVAMGMAAIDGLDRNCRHILIG